MGPAPSALLDLNVAILLPESGAIGLFGQSIPILEDALRRMGILFAMKRAPLLPALLPSLVPSLLPFLALLSLLTLLNFGLVSCKRVSWQIVADPAPLRPGSEASQSERPMATESTPATECELKTELLGESAKPSESAVLEGHCVGPVRVQVLPATCKGQ